MGKVRKLHLIITQCVLCVIQWVIKHHRFNVHTTSFQRSGCCMDVETTLCAERNPNEAKSTKTNQPKLKQNMNIKTHSHPNYRGPYLHI